MYCPECKNKLIEGTATCHYCGKDLSKTRKIKFAEMEDEEQEETFSNVNMDRGQIRDALTYDPFKEKIKFHMIGAVLTIILGIGLLIITYISFGLFDGTLSITLSLIAIILSVIGFIYAFVCIFFFVR